MCNLNLFIFQGVFYYILFFLLFVSKYIDDFLKYKNILNISNPSNNIQLDLNSQIKNLQNELNIKNNIIKQKDLTIMELQNKLNSLNDSYNNNLLSIQNLKKEIIKKDQELTEIKNKIDSNSIQNDNKWGFSISFRPINQEFFYPITCNKNELISRLEEEVYDTYPKYKEYNTYLTCNGVVLKRFKTVGENNIKKGDAILVNIIE